MNSFLETLRNLGPTRLAIMGTVGALLLGALIWVASRFSDPELTLLYGDLAHNDSREIARVLDELGTPYRLENNSILVPGPEVAKLRMEIGGRGLPAGGSVGYKLFDEVDSFGTTNFVQRINQVRALEGELARSIRSLSQVRDARVHLVLPQRELFSRDRREPSASVLLMLEGRLALEEDKGRAIQQVVAAAVPGLKPGRISVVDNSGRVYANGVEDEEAAMTRRHEDMRRSIEVRLTNQIESLVGRSVGMDNVRAQVAVEMDFNREMINSENFDPDGQVPRSVQNVEEQAESTETQGEDPVTVAQNLPDADTAITTGAGAYSRSTRTEETTNFEISRTIRNYTREAGVVKRLSVAVMVDGTYSKGVDAGGAQTLEFIPRTEEELEVIHDLVSAAIGAVSNNERQDEIKVVSLRFHELVFAEEETLIFGMPADEVSEIVRMMVIGLVGVLVVLLVVRPLIGRALDMMHEEDEDELMGLPERPGIAGALGAPTAEELAEMEALEQMIDISQVEGRVRSSSLRKIISIVDKHPEEAVAILRSWLYQTT